MDDELKNIRRVLNKIYLYNKFEYYIWLVDCLVLVFSNI